MSEPSVAPGDRVTWNDLGKSLFGDTGSEGLLVEVRDGLPGQVGLAGHVLWESGQDTWPSLSCLTRVSPNAPSSSRPTDPAAAGKGDSSSRQDSAEGEAS